MSQSSPAHLKLTRFRQRRANLNECFHFLQEALSSSAESRIKNAAIIKAFEMCFELCWKSMKDLLEYQGTVAANPRDTIKEAFKAGILEDGQAWMDLLDRRNVLVHVYNQEQSVHAANEIKVTGWPHLQKLVDTLNLVPAETP